jgi:hypothetical protein
MTGRTRSARIARAAVTVTARSFFSFLAALVSDAASWFCPKFSPSLSIEPWALASEVESVAVESAAS